jgi:cell-division initiation protein
MRKNRKYGKFVVVMQNRRISHNYTWLAGVAAIMLMAIICLVVSRSSGRLTDKNAAYDKQIAALTQQIDEQNKRKEELQTRSIYVTTKQFIEEFAREKLGLVYEDELIFRANDNSGK